MFINFLFYNSEKWLKPVYIYGSYHKIKTGVTLFESLVIGQSDFYSALAELAMQSAVLAAIDTVRSSICLSVTVRYHVKMTQSYDHGVFTGG